MEPKELKIALSMIVEENEPVEMLQRAIGSINRAIDGVFITVTYKEKQPENTPLLKFLADIKANVSFFKWVYRFDEARNFSITQIPKEYDFYIWMDVDDIWQGTDKIRELAREAYIYNIGAMFFEYYYMVDLDESGKIREVLVQHKRERLIRNDDSFKWIGRLHETLIEQRSNVLKVGKKECVVVHLTDIKRSLNNLERNIKILEEAAEAEKGKDPRTLMYLGKAYFDMGKEQKTAENRDAWFEKAEQMFDRYLSGKGTPGIDYIGASGWADERSSAWQYLGEIYRHKNEINKAVVATANSILESPKFPAYYLDMAMNYVISKEYPKAQIWLDIATHVPPPDTTLVMTPRDVKARALEIDYQISVATNQLERAMKSAEKLADLIPTMADLKDRVDSIKKLNELNKVAQSVVYVGKHLESTNQMDKLILLTKALPNEIQNEQFAAQMRNRFLPAKLWKDDEVTIVCGPGFEGWSPKSIERGIGGSEAAVIYMAKELAQLGLKVTVFADPRGEQGIYDGVEYLPWYFLNIKDTFSNLIIWRAIGFLDSGFQAKSTYLWAHDVPNNADNIPQRIKKLTRIMPLSEYHKSLFMQTDGKSFVKIPDEKFFVTRNGTFSFPHGKSLARDPHRMIYTSSYDRGLAHLLAIWPEIRAQVPDAKLSIFYGWQTYDAIYKDNPERSRWKAQMEQMMRQPGITHGGRINHYQLASEYAQSAIFAYPTDFQEISCQNAMSAQIYGAIPVVTNYAALKETVQFGKKVDADITSTEGKEQYVKELVDALKNTEWQKEERTKMMEWAKDKFLWSSIAKEWKKLFEENKPTAVSVI